MKIIIIPETIVDAIFYKNLLRRNVRSSEPNQLLNQQNQKHYAVMVEQQHHCHPHS